MMVANHAKEGSKTLSGAPSLECRCINADNQKSYYGGTGYYNQIGEKNG